MDIMESFMVGGEIFEKYIGKISLFDIDNVEHTTQEE